MGLAIPESVLALADEVIEQEFLIGNLQRNHLGGAQSLPIGYTQRRFVL